MKAVKIVLGVLAALVVLLVLAGVLVASFFNPNDYKGVAADAFTARTGRKLAVTQDLKLSYFPWLAVETGGITIGNAPGFGGDSAESPPFATIEHLAARAPVLVVFEDVHWADEPLLDLIAYLVSHVHDARVVFVVLARPEFLESGQTAPFGAPSSRQKLY